MTSETQKEIAEWRHSMEAEAQLRAAAPDLLAALRLYVRLDNDRRAGCEIDPADWAECHQAARAAIAKATSPQAQ